MRRGFRYIWYGIKWVALLVRYPFYLLHATLVFFSKPGAAFLVPLLLAIVVRFVIWTDARVFAQPYIDRFEQAMARLFGGPLSESAAFWSLEIALLSVELVLTVGLYILGKHLAVLTSALGMAIRPMRPILPLDVRNFTFKTLPAREDVRALPAQRWQGELDELRAMLPESIQRVYGTQAPFETSTPAMPPHTPAHEPQQAETPIPRHKRDERPSGRQERENAPVKAPKPTQARRRGFKAIKPLPKRAAEIQETSDQSLSRPASHPLPEE